MLPRQRLICEEVFRIQPMANEVNLDLSGVGGVGRDVRMLPQGTITVTPTSRLAANTDGFSADRGQRPRTSTRTEIDCSLPIRREEQFGRRHSTATAI